MIISALAVVSNWEVGSFILRGRSVKEHQEPQPVVTASFLHQLIKTQTALQRPNTAKTAQGNIIPHFIRKRLAHFFIANNVIAKAFAPPITLSFETWSLIAQEFAKVAAPFRKECTENVLLLSPI